MEGDIFALYAKMADNNSQDELVTPEPIPHEHISCTLEKGEVEPCIPMKKISTKEELYKEVAVLRKAYEPYLADLAPEIESTRQVFSLKNFMMGEQAVTLPHYDGPIGSAVKSYTTKFELPEFDGRAVYFCCGGADYIATVYINGRCVGIHEGFFSPFEYNITRYAVKGENTLEIVLENDYPFRGNIPDWGPNSTPIQGDKIYAATGIGYDDHLLGWHHCPPGMGLYNGVSIEIRNTLHITDLFVRPDIENHKVEAWVEVENTTYDTVPLELQFSLYGQNFKETIFENKVVSPQFKDKPMPAKHGKHVYKIPLALEKPRLWNNETPWLYQMQVSVLHDNAVCDTVARQFGMRSFTQDVASEPKGMFYLNGEPIRLRGANTMGFEQLDVMRDDYDQLIDDILLAKVCNMNFWRITQRPVQDDVYTYCDRLGLMTQNDFPLFGVMRRTKSCEAIRQVEEMIRMIRNHPSSVVISYMNEPWRSANGEPHRHMLREEMEDLFEIFDKTVLYNHPDCVIKHVDGDFDPPTRNTMPDVHCYTLWYNGGQQDFGLLHRGYGQKVAPGWYYGCGEYGAEGFDFCEIMREYYPPEWVEEPFDPGKIVAAQTKTWHGCFFETPDTMEEWVEATQEHQAFAMKVMTEAYRRDPRMVSTALHLFIDAWPSGWLKTIMDFKRNPKKAFFTSRDALAPLLISIRSDRFTYYAREQVSIETFVCNDTNSSAPEGCRLVYELYKEGKMCMHGEMPAIYDPCTTTYIANVEFEAPETLDRSDCKVKAFLIAADGTTMADQTFNFTVFADVEMPQDTETVFITNLENGIHEIAGETVEVSTLPCHGMTYFLSRKTGHPAVKEFGPKDFRMWYDQKLDRLAPIATQCFAAEGFRPVLIGNGSFNPKTVVGEKWYKGKRYVICLADLREENPVAKRLRCNLLTLDDENKK